MFLVDQSPCEGAGDFNRPDICQRENQSVSNFALELLRRTRVNFSAVHNRLHYLWDRVLPEIRSGAHNNWEKFDHFHIFVAYLQQVQDSLSIWKTILDPKRCFPPRKRFCENENS